ncbi:MAG: hypothetical protein QOH21_959 [Acidobacteriota bacterium]|jgi:hypothetical protein|nr:hypothetical protein [Acidobacteriota bacterium]
MAEMTRVDFAQFAVRELVYPAGRRMARHAHEYSNVTVVVSGDLEETTDDGEHRGRSCSVLLKPAGTMHANYAIGRQGTRTVSVEMPALSPLAQELQSLQWQWLEDPETARAGLVLYRAFRGGSRGVPLARLPAAHGHGHGGVRTFAAPAARAASPQRDRALAGRDLQGSRTRATYAGCSPPRTS